MNKNSNGGGFVKIPWNIIQRTTDAELKTLAVLAHYCSMRGGGFPSIETIAREAGKQRRAVITALDNLTAKGFIEKQTRPGRTTVYRLPGSDSTTPRKNTADQTDGSGGSSAENCTPGEDLNQCKKMHTTSAENCTHNKIEEITLKQEQGQAHKRARKNKKTESESLITFPVKNPQYNSDKAAEMKEQGIKPFLPGAIDKLYLAGLKIGYRMTIDELFKFAWVMIDGGYYSQRGVFHRVRDFDTLLYQWYDAQTPEKARQAISEQERLKAGEEIFSGEYTGRRWGRTAPLPELESIDPLTEHRFYKALKQAGNNRTFTRDVYEEAERAFDALEDIEKERILKVIQGVKKDIDPRELFRPGSKYYWRGRDFI